MAVEHDGRLVCHWCCIVSTLEQTGWVVASAAVADGADDGAVEEEARRHMTRSYKVA